MDRTPGGFLDRRARALVLGRLAGVRVGSLVLTEGGTRSLFGTAGSQPQAVIEVRDPAFYGRLALGGTVGAAESYVDGDWESPDLTSLIRLFALNRHLNEGAEAGTALFAAPLRRLLHWLRRNTRRNSRRNISEHYDLGNDFFALMLDETLSYSCAVFPRPGASLVEASEHKLDLICRKLDLQPDDHLAEIGTGWGGLAIHAAKHFGCRVSTTTISRQQYELARSRIDAEGLSDRVEVVESDYRDLTALWGEGRFDKLVSIEMIEAVGHRYLGDFYSTCSRILKPDGLLLLQAIVMTDRFYNSYRRSVDFIQRYIFPGSLLPSQGTMAAAVADRTDLTLTHLQDLTPHYATTLELWRRNLDAVPLELERLGYSERFRRLWNFYLCYCEGGFRERVIGDLQLLYAKPMSRHLPITADLWSARPPAARRLSSMS